MGTKFTDTAKRVFEIEARGIQMLGSNLDDNFELACTEILRESGKVVVTGMGKSGIIGKKIAATLASTGTSSFFMHPGEAYHGDLGMIHPNDLVLAISNSGETDEVLKLISFIRLNGNLLIGVTGNPESTLAKESDFHLNVAVPEEACPLRLAPTASTTATLAMGDALAMALMEARDFKPEDFAKFHPGGSLGRRLLQTVGDEMIRGPLPFVATGASLMSVLHEITNGRLGLAIVPAGDYVGIITDGDIRRAVEREGPASFDLLAEDLMTKDPITIGSDVKVGEALDYLEKMQITRALVKQEGVIVGVFRK